MKCMKESLNSKKWEMDYPYSKLSLQLWFIKAWESFSSVGWLEVGCGQNVFLTVFVLMEDKEEDNLLNDHLVCGEVKPLETVGEVVLKF